MHQPTHAPTNPAPWKPWGRGTVVADIFVIEHLRRVAQTEAGPALETALRATLCCPPLGVLPALPDGLTSDVVSGPMYCRAHVEAWMHRQLQAGKLPSRAERPAWWAAARARAAMLAVLGVPA